MTTKLLPELPENTSLYGTLVVLARAGWYSSFRMDKKPFSDDAHVGLWLTCPYWLGMPTTGTWASIGWHSAALNDMPGEIGKRCPGALLMRQSLIQLWNETLRELPLRFADCVPQQSGKGVFEIDPISSQRIPDWQPGGSRYHRRFSPMPRNLPEITEDWIAARSLDGKAWEYENPLASLIQFPHALDQKAKVRQLPFSPQWNMVSLVFSALSDYGHHNEETWMWRASNYVSRFETPNGCVGMIPGKGEATRISVPSGDDAWNTALSLAVDQTLDFEAAVYADGPDTSSVFQYKHKR